MRPKITQEELRHLNMNKFLLEDSSRSSSRIYIDADKDDKKKNKFYDNQF